MRHRLPFYAGGSRLMYGSIDDDTPQALSALLNRTPSRATRSKWGVSIQWQPYARHGRDSSRRQSRRRCWAACSERTVASRDVRRFITLYSKLCSNGRVYGIFGGFARVDPVLPARGGQPAYSAEGDG